MSEGDDIFTRGLLFQWASSMHIKLSKYVYYKAAIISISSKWNVLSLWYSCKCVHLTLNNNHSLNIHSPPVHIYNLQEATFHLLDMIHFFFSMVVISSCSRNKPIFTKPYGRLFSWWSKWYGWLVKQNLGRWSNTSWKRCWVIYVFLKYFVMSFIWQFFVTSSCIVNGNSLSHLLV